MKNLLLAGMISLALVFPAFAQSEEPSAPSAACDYVYDDTVAQITSEGTPIKQLDPADIPEMLAKLKAATGQDFPNVTRAFLAIANGMLYLGLEQNGCLLSPIILGSVTPTPAAQSLSGSTPYGTFA
jgi:hypothetical protein